ncbi:MAG: AraC family transcriptional regulator [Desulfobacteraceae bacterium]|nr:AraC family transcriptional regulator [Desulfobacteraceae bacterium]
MSLKVKQKVRFSRYPDIGNLELLHASYKKQTFTPHYHEGHVIGVIEKGNLGFDYRGEKVVASAGEINIADPGVVHNGFSVSKQGWQYRMFYLKQGQLDQICNELCDRIKPMPFFKKGVIKDKTLAQEIQTLHMDFEDPKVSLLEKESRFFSLISKMIRKHAKNSVAPIFVRKERKSVKKVKEYIQSFYGSNISLDDLSKVAKISRYYLLRVFAKETGLTPHIYLNHIRALKAKQLLEKKVPIIDTAYATGFFDQSHLNRIFKKIYGITPGQYCEN